MVLSIGYTHRETRRNIGQRNTAPAADIFAVAAPRTVTEVTSGQVVTVYNRPSTATANLFFNSDLSRHQLQRHRHHAEQADEPPFLGDRRRTFGQTDTGIGQGGDLNNPNVIKNAFFLARYHRRRPALVCIGPPA